MPPIPAPQQAPAAAQTQGGAPGGQDQPPVGSSPVTGKTPNLGYEAAGAQRMAMLVTGMGETIPLVGAASEAGVALADCIRKLAKFVPTGAVNSTGQRNVLDQMRLKQAQQGALLQQIGKGAAAGGAPPPAAAA